MKYKVGAKVRMYGYLAEVTAGWKTPQGPRYEVLFIKGRGNYQGYWTFNEETIIEQDSGHKTEA